MRTGSRPHAGLERLDVAELPLVGGALCLDFVNTTGARASAQPRERLRGYTDVVTWSRRAASANALELGSTRAHSPGSEAALQRVRAVRETLYRILCAVAETRTPARKDVHQIDRLSREDRSRRALVIDSRGATLKVARRTSALDELIYAAVESAVTLLRSDRVRHLKRCAECDWLFLDDTKNQSRTWCKKACGDRVRARRHYQVRRLGRRTS